MKGEVEVMRSVLNDVPTVPRFSDIYCMFQSSKFELDEIEDTTENKIKFLNNTISEIIKEISKEYFAKVVDAEELSNIKKEFKNKVFTVLQNQYQRQQQQQQKPNNYPPSSSYSESNAQGSDTSNNSGGSFLYSEQLKQFPFTKKIVERVEEKIRAEQAEYIRKAKNTNISANLEYLDYNNETNGDFDQHEETLATIKELFLEYLRFSTPPILDRKENRFEYMDI
jgi:magnesium chelatase subunit I